MKRTLSIGIVLVLLLAFVGAVSANLVSNGGFENPKAVGEFTPDMAGGLANWDIIAGNIDLIGSHWMASEKDQSIDLSGCARATISQDISTTPGKSFRLTFDLAGNPFTDSTTIRKVAIYWGNENAIIRSFDTNGKSRPDNMGWTTITDLPDLQASTNPTTLKFQDVSENDNACVGIALDNIVVEEQKPIPTPEFPTMALPAALIVGMLGAVLFIQRSKEE